VLYKAMASLQYIRKHVEIQGFHGLSDEQLTAVAPWLRFTPTLNFLMISLGTAMGSAAIIGITAFLMFIGALGRAHPFDALYNLVIRPLTGSARLPPSADRRRFVFAVGAIWLGATAIMFTLGHTITGYILGSLIAVMVIPLATAYFCLISEPMELLFGPARPYVES